ncbi:MAG: NADP-dependent oxidoreductase domain [Erysipelotrichaceae bacterium]|nr:MAG: NADP-dependent oxidoreductase [Erysipelotrichaceae bacterium]TXT19251.1 MAG: NADP-dependent oxidoreductase domain [Erysipelotrichaceae bacterium]
MHTRKFDKSGISPSLLGFGCMRFPTLADGSIDEVKATAMIETAMANGVTYIDTAYPYHNGESEPFVGKVLKNHPRSSFYLATKLPIWLLKTKEDALRIFNEQLDRLQVDYFDFYLLHALDQEKWDLILELDVIGVVEKLKAEGKIKNLGFSFHDEYPVFEKIATYRAWDFCQIQYNYIDTKIQAGDKGYDLTVKLGIPLIVMEPIKGGMLATLPHDISHPFKDYDPKASLSSWALRWAATHQNVKVILSGMSSMEHVTDNLNTFNNYKDLSDEEMGIVNKVTDIINSRTKNGCTSCEYCMPCPFGVNIPRNFKIWNDYSIFKDEAKTIRRYWTDLKPEARADMCQACGACEALCPQHIHIIDDLVQVAKDIPHP